jgi:hypothetical protein
MILGDITIGCKYLLVTCITYTTWYWGTFYLWRVVLSSAITVALGVSLFDFPSGTLFVRLGGAEWGDSLVNQRGTQFWSRLLFSQGGLAESMIRYIASPVNSTRVPSTEVQDPQS